MGNNTTDLSQASQQMLQQSMSLLKDIDTLLEKYDRKTLIPGDHISITETEQGILIQADTQEIPDGVKRWILDAEQRLNQPPVITGERGINVEWDGSGYRISLEKSISQEVLPSAEQETDHGPATITPFPFQVVLDSPSGENGPSIKIYGWNPDEGREFRSLVYAGLSKPIEIPETILNIQASGFIYVRVWKDANDEYTAGLYFSVDILTPQNGTWEVPIAYVKMKNNGNVLINQMHWGNIFVAGRIV